MTDQGPIDSWQASIVAPGKNQRYNFMVDLIYLSDQVARFKVHSRGRYVILEKNLILRSGEKWKITSTDIIFSEDIKGNTHAMLEIFKILDEYLKGRSSK